MIKRKITRSVVAGTLTIGGGAPVSVQSMTNTDTRDVKATLEQIKRLEEAGCDMVRLAVPDMEAARAVKEIRKATRLPLVADIHFDYRLALECIDNGIDKVRINPGNIGSRDRVKAVVQKAKERKIPIRIGINSGSIQKELLAKYGGPTAEAMVESAKSHIEILEQEDFHDIVISLKATNVITTIEAYEMMAEKYDYPLHVGITESGTIRSGTIKSSVGIGAILSRGIGDTIRVSLTGDPVEEVIVGKQILAALNLGGQRARLISCPTCGRTRVNLIEIANKIEEAISGLNKDITVAVMGCAVNGPGESREADIGIAGGDGEYLLFKKGKIVGKLPMDRAAEILIEEIKKL